MASFKHKPSKIKYNKDMRTLDEIHHEIIDKFDEQYTKLPIYKQELEIIRGGLGERGEKIITNKEMNEMIIKREELEKKIKQIENGYEELEYFDKTGDILLKYYDDNRKMNNEENKTEIREEIIEEKEEKSKEETEEESENNKLTEKLIILNEMSRKKMKIKKPIKKRNYIEQPNSKSILSFLGKENDKEGDKEEIEVIIDNKLTLKNEYLSLVDPTYNKSKIIIIRNCTKCIIEKVFVQSEGIYVCPKCGEFEYLIIDSDIPNHKDSTSEKPRYPYKRINHFMERLNQFQSKESSSIPSNVYDIIKEEIRKQRIPIEEITPITIKIILKKHRLNNYYEHHQHIFSKITNTPPFILSREIEDKIRNMFIMIQEPFRKYKPNDRSNFLNYTYLLNKMFMILGLLLNAKYCSLLKSREKLRQQDIVWKKICIDLNWNYHSSI